jgi:site-specific DNA-methyltransferase (adenine-specific)
MSNETSSEWKNKLYLGDNLDILREKVPDESVDLIYLDPPFNSNASYNVLFKERSGEESRAQIHAFEDTWQWGLESQAAYEEIITTGPPDLAALVRSLRGFLGQTDMMAYLVMMGQRLVELHRVLKPTGSIYLHCDPTASHYLKLLMDAVFGFRNYRNDIIWRRSINPKGSQHQAKHFGVYTDNILFFSKSKDITFNIDRARIPLTPEELEAKYDRKDELGRFYDGPILRSASMGVRPNLVYEY